MNKVVKIKKEKTLQSAITNSSIKFKSIEDGMDVLAFSAAIRAMGLSNRDTQPKKLSNFIRSGYMQIQLICSVILYQFSGQPGVSRDDLYDDLCEVFPNATYANFRKILATAVDNEIFIRTRSKEDSRRTIYSISNEMIEPLCAYFLSILGDFGNLYSGVLSGGLSDEDSLTLINRMRDSAGLKMNEGKKFFDADSLLKD